MEEVTTTQTQQSGSASTPVDVKPPMGTGTAGLQTQVGGAPTTVSGVQNASGGMGELVLPEVDKRIFMFERGNYALMELMLMAKRVNVKSMVVKHYAIDQGTPIVTVASINGNVITLVNADKGKVRAYDTLMVKGVKGYEFVKGTGNVMSRRPLQLFVKSVNADDTITCVATNGVKQAETDEYGSLPTSNSPTASNTNVIVAGTKLVRMANALYETQKWVDPNTVIPVPDELYLQKRGMTSIVSKYLADQKMEVPYEDAVKAEAQLREFKAAGNRTLLISQQSRMEKPRAFDPRGQSGADPVKTFFLDPHKVLADGVIFILPCYFLAYILRMLSPVSSMRWAVWTILSRMASATVGSPMASYQLETGSCEDMMIDLRPWRSSIMSSRMGRSLASMGTRNASSSMSSLQRSIFLSSVSSVPLALATLSMLSSLVVLAYRVRMPLLQAW